MSDSLRHWKLWRFALPLADGGVREGLLVGIEDGEGHVGYGEASPYPGLNPETPVQAMCELMDWLRQHEGRRLPLAAEIFAKRPPRGFERLSSSARCGLEAALWELESNRRGVAPETLLSEKPSKRVRVNALVADVGERALSRAHDLVREGYHTLKLKVGRRDPEADASWVRRVRERVGDGVRLRLDANRGWSGSDALVFLRAIADLDIEYVEEPSRDPRALRALYAASRVIQALDETTREASFERLLGGEGIGAVVIKPTAVGGLGAAARLARAASSLGRKAVFSSSFESGVGLLSIARLAAGLGDPDTAMGLGTSGWFSQDLLARPVTTIGELMELPARALSKADIRWEVLRPVAGSA